MNIETITTIKVKLYPNKKQREIINQNLGSSRWIWNYMLSQMLTTGYMSYNDMANKLPNIKNENPWLKDINSQSLQQTLKKLALSTKFYFKNRNNLKLKPGMPKFKSIKDNKDYIIVPQHWEIVDNKIKLPKLGLIKISGLHKNIIDILEYKQVIIKRDATGNYIANIVVNAIVYKPDNNIDGTIGLDVNSSNLLTDSNGTIIPALHNNAKIKKLYGKIKRLQIKLSNKVRYGKSYNIIKFNIAKLWYRINNIKNDLLHKVSNTYSKYKFIHMEKLNIRKMTKNTKGTITNPNMDSKRKTKLNRTILSNNWFKLMTLIKYKAERIGNKLLLINPEYTSQRCSKCGYISKDNRESQSVFKCKSCEFELNADYNAAINIQLASS